MALEKLFSNQREQEILRELRLAGGNCRIGFLANRLHVSEETIRRNIKALVKKSLVKKVHGGVYLAEQLTLSEQPFQNRMDKNSAIKQALAAKAATIIKDGDSLFLDIGSTTAYVAQALRNHRNLYIVTNSVTVGYLLATRNNNRVFLAGGELRSHDGGAFGIDATNFISRFNVEYAILSVGAVNAKSGFMLHDIKEADLSRVAISIAQTKIIIADADKFGQRGPIAIEHPKNIDILITDKKPSEEIKTMLGNNDISILYPHQ